MSGQTHFFLAPNVRMRLDGDGRFDELIMYDGDLVVVAHVRMDDDRLLIGLNPFGAIEPRVAMAVTINEGKLDVTAKKVES